MKSNYSQRLFWIVLSAFLSFSVLLFRNEIPVMAQVEGSRWVYVTESVDGYKFYLDSTYNELSSGIRVIWEKQVGKDGAYDLSLMEFNCALGKQRSTQFISYDRRGNTIVSDTSPYAKWEAPVPETINEALFQKVCNVKRGYTSPKPSEPKYREPETKRSTQEMDDLGVDYAIITASRANLREDADINSTAIREIPQGDLVVLLNRNPVGLWFNVIHVKSNQEGWIHSSIITIKYTKNRKPNLTIAGTNTGSSRNPVLEVKNDSDITMTLKLGDNQYVFSPRESKTIPMSPARYSFHASAPNVIPDFGDQYFEVGYIYSWRFYIVTVRR